MCLLQAAPSSGESLSAVGCKWTLTFWGWVTGLFFGQGSLLERVLSIQVQKSERLHKRDMGAAASQLLGEASAGRARPVRRRWFWVELLGGGRIYPGCASSRAARARTG